MRACKEKLSSSTKRSLPKSSKSPLASTDTNSIALGAQMLAFGLLFKSLNLKGALQWLEPSLGGSGLCSSYRGPEVSSQHYGLARPSGSESTVCPDPGRVGASASAHICTHVHVLPTLVDLIKNKNIWF